MLASLHRSTRLAAAAVLLGGALAFQPAAPPPLQAGIECTIAYTECLTKARKLAIPLRQMGYVECMAEWVGCVSKKAM